MRERFFKRSEWVAEIEVDGAECHDPTDHSSHRPVNDFISSHSASKSFASEERPDGPAKCDSLNAPSQFDFHCEFSNFGCGWRIPVLYVKSVGYKTDGFWRDPSPFRVPPGRCEPIRPAKIVLSQLGLDGCRFNP